MSAYLIDTDIEVDSVPNGKKDDDIDNEGTGSKTSGSPFRIPDNHTKKVQTLRVTFIGEDGSEK